MKISAQRNIPFSSIPQIYKRKQAYNSDKGRKPEKFPFLISPFLSRLFLQPEKNYSNETLIQHNLHAAPENHLPAFWHVVLPPMGFPRISRNHAERDRISFFFHHNNNFRQCFIHILPGHGLTKGH